MACVPWRRQCRVGSGRPTPSRTARTAAAWRRRRRLPAQGGGGGGNGGRLGVLPHVLLGIVEAVDGLAVAKRVRDRPALGRRRTRRRRLSGGAGGGAGGGDGGGGVGGARGVNE